MLTNSKLNFHQANELLTHNKQLYAKKQLPFEIPSLQRNRLNNTIDDEYGFSILSKYVDGIYAVNVFSGPSKTPKRGLISC